MASSKPSLMGLRSALTMNTADPLGLDAQARGMQAAQESKATGDPNYLSGPLQDPKWAGYFQTLADQGVSGIAQDAAPEPTMYEDPKWRTSGDVRTIRDPQDPLMASPNSIMSPSLRGLKKAKK